MAHAYEVLQPLGESITDTIKTSLLKLKKTTDLERIARVLDVNPVLNDATCQQMVFCPAAGEYRAWRKV